MREVMERQLEAVEANSKRGAVSKKSTTATELQIEALETRLLAMISTQQVQHSAELRDAHKLANYALEEFKERLNIVEQQQERLCTQLTALAAAVEDLRKGSAGQPVAPAEKEKKPAPPQAASVEALEKRLRELEESRSLGAAADDPLKSERSRRSDTIFIAIQDLEATLNSEVKAMRRRCNACQEGVDNALVPLRNMERQVQEQDQIVKQLLDHGQEWSSRIEEHEVRLGVARTKLEVHDAKISRLESMPWRSKLIDGDRSSHFSTGGAYPG
jgi:chromosome segregation ATPase